jgi:hypothetical protein
MSFHYLFNQRNIDFHAPYSLVVKRAGNDQLQRDMINMILSHDETATREGAIALLEKYAFTIENLLNLKDKFYYEQQAGSSDQLPGFKQTDINCKPLNKISERFISKNPIQPIKQNHPANIPVLRNCFNVVSNTRIVMSGSVMQVEGDYLYFDKNDIKQGIFLIEMNNKNIIKVATLVRIKSDNIIFMMPGGLTAGNYNLELRARCQQTGILHTGVLQGTIDVVI